MKSLKVRYDLPAEMQQAIGAIVTRWAYAENYIQGVVYLLLGLGFKEGRIAVREPRLNERLAMIADLCAIHDFHVDQSLKKRLTVASIQLKFERDLYAHSAWTFADNIDSWAVQVTTGTWEQIAKAPELAGIKKKITPQGLPVNLAKLQSTVSALDKLIADLRSLQEDVFAEIEASDKTRPSPLDPMDRGQG